MKIEKYGDIAETKAERREVSATYSAAKANTFVFACVDWAHPLNGKGKDAAELRRQYFANAPADVRAKYIQTRTIGTPWIEVEVATSTLHDLKGAEYLAFFTARGQMKLKPEAVAILQRLIAEGKARIVAHHDDYVLDMFDAWLAEGKNWGYAFEVFRFGKSNRDTEDRVDGQHHQAKACLTLYRTEPRERKGHKPYDIGTQDGISTANGVKSKRPR